MAFLFSFHNGGAIEGADFLRNPVEVMKDAIVGFLWDAVYIADVFGRPGDKDEEEAVLTGMENGRLRVSNNGRWVLSGYR